MPIMPRDTALFLSTIQHTSAYIIKPSSYLIMPYCAASHRVISFYDPTVSCPEHFFTAHPIMLITHHPHTQLYLNLPGSASAFTVSIFPSHPGHAGPHFWSHQGTFQKELPPVAADSGTSGALHLSCLRRLRRFRRRPDAWSPSDLGKSVATQASWEPIL